MRLVPPLLCLLLLTEGAARAADPQPYDVKIAPTGDPALDAAITGASRLVALRGKAPVSPFALVSRARLDVARLRTALDSEGFYDGTIAITLLGRTLDDPSLPAALAALPAGQKVTVMVTPQTGPRFSLGAVTLTGTLPAPLRAGFPLHPGQPARAAAVLAAGTALLKALQDDGYALAAVPPPVAYAHPAQHTLDVTFTVQTGPRVDLGPITLAGLKRVHPSFVRRRLLLRQGMLYNPDRIEAARQDLAALPVFASVRVTASARPDAAGQLPLTFTFGERLRYVVALNAAYATDLGGSAGISWTNRNVFGNAEQLTLAAAVTELGGTAAQQPGYNVSASLLTPDWLRRDQTLQYDALAVREYLDAYDRTAITLDALVTRRLSRQISVSAGISATQERVTQEDVGRDYSFIGIPIGVKYDTTDSLLAPTRGIRAAATVTPTESFGAATGSATYALLHATGATYLNLARPGRSVLALRVTLGATEGAGQFDLPPDQRLYAGGTDTIRGYKYQSVGPLFADERPQGGTSLDAASVEFRQRFGKSYGAAVFVDAGQVGTTGVPFTGPLRAGAGVGARYYTAIGPIRLDVAVPLIKQAGGGDFDVYIGLGEAF